MYLGNQALADGNDVSLVQGLLGLLGNVDTGSGFLIDPNRKKRIIFKGMSVQFDPQHSIREGSTDRQSEE